ncbi:hypothetical protein U1Q18_043216 [Sarracenia purpurea var. burkii]
MSMDQTSAKFKDEEAGAITERAVSPPLLCFENEISREVGVNLSSSDFKAKLPSEIKIGVEEKIDKEDGGKFFEEEAAPEEDEGDSDSVSYSLEGSGSEDEEEVDSNQGRFGSPVIKRYTPVELGTKGRSPIKTVDAMDKVEHHAESAEMVLFLLPGC